MVTQVLESLPVSARVGDHGRWEELKRMKWYQGLSGVRVLGQRGRCIIVPFSTDGEARTFNGSIELCRADSDSSQKVGFRKCQDLARGWEMDCWPVDP